MIEKKTEQEAPLFSVELDQKSKELISVLFSISAINMLLLIDDCRNSLQHHPEIVKSSR
jgi:hypothetical protein